MKHLLFLSLLAMPFCLFAEGQYKVVKQTPLHQGSIDLQKELMSFNGTSIATTRSVMELNSKPDGYRWIDRMSNMPDYCKDFYDTYGTAVSQVLAGTDNWLSSPESAAEVFNGVYGVLVKSYTNQVMFSVPENASMEEVKELAWAAIEAEIDEQWKDANCFFPYMCMSLTYDYTEAFWLSSSFSWFDAHSNSVSWDNMTGTVEYKHDIYYQTKQDGVFDIRRSCFNSVSSIASGLSTYIQSVDAILSGVPSGGSRYDVLKYFNNWLTTHNYYNPYLSSNACTQMAWSPLSSLAGMEEKDAPVCEGYARAFKVLCDKLDIPCVLCVGLAKNRPNSPGESHMWNEVLMNDDKWYAVDVTWNDPTVSGATPKKISGYETESWLLLGSQDENPSGFTFAESHPFSLSKMVHEEYLKQWDLDFRSLITENKYDPAGIDAVISESGAPAEIYTLGGIPVSEVTQGFYILRKDGTSSKIFVK